MHIEFNSSGLQREVHSPEGVQGAITEFYIFSMVQTPCFPFNIASRGNRAFWSSDSSASVSGSRVWRTSSVNALWLASGRIYSLILVVPKSTRQLSVYFLLSQTGRFYCTLHKGVQHIRRSVFSCISSQ